MKSISVLVFKSIFLYLCIVLAKSKQKILKMDQERKNFIQKIFNNSAYYCDIRNQTQIHFYCSYYMNSNRLKFGVLFQYFVNDKQMKIEKQI